MNNLDIKSKYYDKTRGDRMTQIKQKFNVTGMTCSACSARVEKALAKLPGINQYSVNVLTNSMSVQYNETQVSSDEIILAVVNAGYGATLSQEKKEQTQINKKVQDKENFSLRLRVSFACLIPLMYVSMGHMVDFPLPSFLLGHHNAIAFGFTQFLLTLPICYVNRHYFFHGFQALFRGNANMDSLIAIGSSAALFYGIFAIYRIGYGLGIGDMALVEQYHMDLYFESCATILSLITLGKYFEEKSKVKTSEALTKLIDLAPKTAFIEVNGTEIEKNCEDLKIGDVVLVKPGCSIPVDGEILDGASYVDQSAITGESIPVEKNIGDTVISATMNKNGFLKIKATKVGNETIFSQIVALVEEASSTKAPIAKLADRISGIFVPVVITLSVLTGIVWLAMGYPFELSLSFAITVLVISCPCALGLATPVAIMVGTGKGAEHGILVKSGEALETAHSINTVILDKTGTITEGKPQVTDVITFSGNSKYLLQVACNLERQSEHPLGQAIFEYGNLEQVENLEITDFKAVLGRGVIGNHGKSTFYGGNEAFFLENKLDFSKYKEQMDTLAYQGKAPLLFAENQTLLGIIAVADQLKSESKDAILALKSMGLDVFMVTGDNEKTAQYIGKELALSGVIAEVLPQEKESIVKEHQNKGKKVAMVGDGINDAPALIRADVGISMANGTDIAIESGDIVLMNGDLTSVVTAIALSKKVILNIKQNLFWAFFYNILGIPLAMGLFYLPFGLKLTPMFGAVAMSFSSLFVVSNALRLRNFKGMKAINKSSSPNVNTTVRIAENTEKEMKNMITLNIEGMMCMHCVNHVTKALTAVEGSSDIAVDLEKKQATVSGDESLLESLKSAVAEAGYEVTSTSLG